MTRIGRTLRRLPELPPRPVAASRTPGRGLSGRPDNKETGLSTNQNRRKTGEILRENCLCNAA
jgi:hypothetical protein